MRENQIAEIRVKRDRPFITANCFDCHLEHKPDLLVRFERATKPAIKFSRGVAERHEPRGHRIFFVIGEK